MRSICHLDADAFFASVEQAADARLRHRPVAVGGTVRGVVASASYEARRFGIHAAMPMAQAVRLCPKLVVLSGDYEKYERFSHWMFSYAGDLTPDVEQASIDEGYCDFSRGRMRPQEAAATLARAIRQGLHITVSEGLASNKLVSQVACKLHKPAGFTHVPAGWESRFLAPLPTRYLPGVGPVLGRKLDAAGLPCIGHLAEAPAEVLEAVAGAAAPRLRLLARGEDDRPVQALAVQAKSYSRQRTFEEDQICEAALLTELRHMAAQLMRQVRKDGQSIRELAVRLHYSDFARDSASETLAQPTDLEDELSSSLQKLLRRAWRRRVAVRLVALRLSRVYRGGAPRHELPLFDARTDYTRLRRLAAVVDQLYETPLRSRVFRAVDLPRPARPVSSPTASPPRHRSHLPEAVTTSLHNHSVYSFLDSTLWPDELARFAAEQGLESIALTDSGNLHGAVPFARACERVGVRPIIGAEVLLDNRPLLLFPEDAAAYARLCVLLSAGSNFQSEHFPFETTGMLAVGAHASAATLFARGSFWMGRSRGGAKDSSPYPVAAVPPAHYTQASDHALYEVLQSIRTSSLLHQQHASKQRSAGRHLKTVGEFRQAFESRPDALRGAREIAERARFSFSFGVPKFPAWYPPDGSCPGAFLRRLVYDGLRTRYAEKEQPAIRSRVDRELDVISEVGYEEYFLVVWDLLQKCRQMGISWITRGSAADSLVCFCLGISSVCPVRFDLYFQRFLNVERMRCSKLPDIDIDFEYDRREEVLAHIFEKYGRAYAAVVGGFSTYCTRSAFADAAKVLGASEREVRRISRGLPHGGMGGEGSVPGLQRNLQDEPWCTAVALAAKLHGAPRHRKMHPCGVVLSPVPMTNLTPVFSCGRGWPATHFDMDAVEEVGLIKLDVLGQAGLSVLRDTKAAVAGAGISPSRAPAAYGPWDDERVWGLISSGGARAVHHIESPAMLSLARRCQVRTIDQLTALVSVIRPGAANEHKKERFALRCQGLEAVEYAHPSLEKALRDSYGLLVYEEQVLRICEDFSGLSPGISDRLRRALAKNRIEEARAFAPVFVEAARAAGRSEDAIQAVWKLLVGFSGYAFCKAHSCAYAVEAYESAWYKTYYPAPFMAAVLQAGRGFYRPLVYVLELWRLGLRPVPPNVQDPVEAFEARGTCIHIPLKAIGGLSDDLPRRIQAACSEGPFASLADLYERVRPDPADAERLLEAGALDSFGRSRATLFRQIQFLKQHHGVAHDQGQLWPAVTRPLDTGPMVEPSRMQRLEREWALFGYAVSAHPLELFSEVYWESYCSIERLHEYVGQQVTCCGLVVQDRLAHQKDGREMKFMTLADRTGLVEAEVFAAVYRNFGAATVRHPVLEVDATVESCAHGQGFSLRVHRAGAPRMRAKKTAPRVRRAG